MGCKDFAPETKKKIVWVKTMYDDWRSYRNSLGHLNYIVCDLDDGSTINPENLCYALCCFINEVKKVDGSDFPPHMLKDIIHGVQFYLEMQGYCWHLT